METKRTIEQVVAAYRLIDAAKLNKMEDSEKFSLIKIARELKRSHSDFEDLIKTAQDKLKPENFDVLSSKLQSRKELTPEEKNVVDKYNKDVADCVKEELAKNVELNFTPLGEDVFGRFVASNDFTTGEIMAIGDVICG